MDGKINMPSLIANCLARLVKQGLVSAKAAKDAEALHDGMQGRLGEGPAGEVWVHCEAGYRASVAASMLEAGGRNPVAVDDDFDNAEQVGLDLERPDAA